MSAEDRAIFDELVMESTEYEFDTFKEAVEKGKEEAEAHGAIFVYPDTNEFREKCQPLLDSIANQSDMTKDIYNKVEAHHTVGAHSICARKDCAIGKQARADIESAPTITRKYATPRGGQRTARPTGVVAAGWPVP